MTTIEYKELMKFHLLLCDYNIDRFNYAAVDSDGNLYVYGLEPINQKLKNNSFRSQWTPAEEVADALTSAANFQLITTMTRPLNWKDTLIKL